MIKLALHFSPDPLSKRSLLSLDEISESIDRYCDDQQPPSAILYNEDSIQYTKFGDIKYTREVGEVDSKILSDLFDSATSTVSDIVRDSDTYYLSLIIRGEDIGEIFTEYESEIFNFTDAVSSGSVSYTELSNQSAKLSLCDWSSGNASIKMVDAREETQAD